MTDLDMLRPKLREMVDRELQPGETIRWVGQPGAVQMVRKAWPRAAFGLVEATFVAMLLAALLLGISSLILDSPTFGAFFLLIGLMELSEPLGIFRKARSTVYVLTDKRAIVFRRRLLGPSVRSFPPEELGFLRRTEDAHGRGDLVFDEDDSANLPHVRYARDTALADPNAREVGFMEIPEVERVEGLVKALYEEFVADSADRQSMQESSPTGGGV